MGVPLHCAAPEVVDGSEKAKKEVGGCRLCMQITQPS